VAEQPRAPFAQHGRDLVVQRIPLQERVERDWRVRQCPLHVRHAPAGGGVRVGELTRSRRGGGLVDRSDSGHAAIMPSVNGLQPGSELGSYRIDAVERTDGDTVVLRADGVLLHVSDDPRLLDRARRLHGVEHPHLLRLRGARTVDGHAVAELQAPEGERLDRATPPDAIAFVIQLAGAVEALEDTGADVPPIVRERVWVRADGAALLDGLGAQGHGVSASADLARLLEELRPRRSPALDLVLTRAFEGAYLSSAQFAAELRSVEIPARQPWWRRHAPTGKRS